MLIGKLLQIGYTPRGCVEAAGLAGPSRPSGNGAAQI